MSEERGLNVWDARKGSVVAAPFPRAPIPLPSPRSSRGTFYLAEKRNFLLCVDTANSVRCHFLGTGGSDICL